MAAISQARADWMLTFGGTWPEDLSDLDFRQMIVRNTDWSRRILDGSDFRRTRLLNVDLRGASLQNCDFREARVTECDFREASLQNCDFREARVTECDFREANLDHAQFDRTTFNNVRMTNSSAKHTSFVEAQFFAAGKNALNGSNFEASDFTAVNLRDCDLRRCSLRYAQLQLAELPGRSWVKHADFTEAVMVGTVWQEAEDLNFVRGLPTFKCGLSPLDPRQAYPFARAAHDDGWDVLGQNQAGSIVWFGADELEALMVLHDWAVTEGFVHPDVVDPFSCFVLAKAREPMNSKSLRNRLLRN